MLLVGAVAAPWPLKLWRFMAPAKPLPLLTAVTSTSSPASSTSAADLLADLVAGGVVEAQLDELRAGLDAGLGEVAGLAGLFRRWAFCVPKVTWRAL